MEEEEAPPTSMDEAETSGDSKAVVATNQRFEESSEPHYVLQKAGRQGKRTKFAHLQKAGSTILESNSAETRTVEESPLEKPKRSPRKVKLVLATGLNLYGSEGPNRQSQRQRAEEARDAWYENGWFTTKTPWWQRELERRRNKEGNVARRAASQEAPWKKGKRENAARRAASPEAPWKKDKRENTAGSAASPSKANERENAAGSAAPPSKASKRENAAGSAASPSKTNKKRTQQEEQRLHTKDRT